MDLALLVAANGQSRCACMTSVVVGRVALHHVQGVSFDAADTLFYNTSVWDVVGADVAAQGVSRPAWEAAVDAAGLAGLWPEDSSTYPERRARWAEFYTQCLARTPAGPCPSIAEAAAAAATDARCFAQFPDTLACLDRLAAGEVPLIVTSNFDALLHEILDALDLTRWFVGVVCSFEAGCRKPDTAIFETSASALGLRPSAVLHVGDSPMSDGAGARAAGMTPLIVDRRRRTVPTTLATDSLDQLGLA
jgi:FMN phosphatase YigB (HAD superfamily)